jgi:enolase/cell division protein FtsB
VSQEEEPKVGGEQNGGTIRDIVGREILDSRGNPTVEVDVILDAGIIGRAAVPSGASTGAREALELRDKDPERFAGKGVRKAVRAVERRILPALTGIDAVNQVFIDNAMLELDGTRGKSKLGANAILGVSMAVAKAAAEWTGQPLYRYLGGTNTKDLPVPMLNVLNGGAHADNNVDVQEFMIVPVGADSFAEAMRCGVECDHALKGVLRKQGLSTAVGDEGGFAPNLESNEQALEVLAAGVGKAGYRLGRDVVFALDVAASELYSRGRYRFAAERKADKSREELVRLYASWVKKYPIASIEDGMAEGDWKGCGGRRRVRHQPRDPGRGDPQERRQQHPDQVEPDRNRDRNPRLHPTGVASRVHLRDLPPFGGDRGFDHRGSGGGAESGTDQDRCPVSWRAHREIQSVAADRRRAGGGRPLSGPFGLPPSRGLRGSMRRLRIRVRWRRPGTGYVPPPPVTTDARQSDGAPPRRGPDPDVDRRRRVRRRLVVGVLGSVFLLGTAQALFGDGGYLDLRRSRHEATELRAEVKRQLDEVVALKRSVRSLREDPQAIERLAREELGFAHPGEIQFLLPRTEEDTP